MRKRTAMSEGLQMSLTWELEEAPPRPSPEAGAPPDWEERERALDVRASWIVEAPAGSGKTGLLIQRYLKLLSEGEIDRPEEVLAITFTNAAAAEIRKRVLTEIERAAAGTETRDTFEQTTRSLAKAVLARDAERGWGLLETPQRLNVRTIDSVCVEIARAMPVTSGGTAGLTPVREAEPLYREAGRRTLLQLGGDDPALDAALQEVLLHRDGNVGNCEELIAQMLAAREQWGTLVPRGPGDLSDEHLEQLVRPRLNRTLEMVVCRGLTRLANALPPDALQQMSLFAADLSYLPSAEPGEHPFAVCRSLREAPAETIAFLDHWRALVGMIVTKEGGLRKAINKGTLKIEIEKPQAEALKALVEGLRGDEELQEALKGFLALPPPEYPPHQWKVAKALFRVLSRALVELQLVFAERGECDFAEPALLARSALREQRGTERLESALGLELRHLLVDEMQDTSTGQYELIGLLTEGWDGEGKTVFLVGDPKQSIYLFRQARVERFVKTMETGLLQDLPLGVLRLTANFRSQAGLVGGFNETFAEVFATGLEGKEAVRFVAAEAVRETADNAEGLAWHTAVCRSANGDVTKEKRHIARQNALAIRSIAEGWRARDLPPGRVLPWQIAVLVRSRTNLREIVAAFQAEGDRSAMPFRAVDVEPLRERREILDLLALTRALRHPADRTAWWAVLRAPWCGLRLRDLHMLAGADAEEFARATVMELVKRRGELLSEDGRARLGRVWPTLLGAMERRSRLRVPELVERTWRSLGGDAVLDDASLRNAMRYFELLEEVDRELGEVELRQVTRRMTGLYGAPAAADASAVDLMTIHGAKGLEWDVVIVPELEGPPPNERGRLLEWEELTDGDDEAAAAIVLAPIAAKGDDADALTRWLRGVRGERYAAERRRLFYVAATRAREELHLFGTANRDAKTGEPKAEARSLLQAAWPAAERYFRERGDVVAWPTAREIAEEPGLSLAAAAEDGVAEDGGMRPALLERLPLSFDPLARFRHDGTEPGQVAEEELWPRLERPEGSFTARSQGNAVHAFLELAARRLEGGAGVEEMLGEVSGWRERVSAVLRGDGLRPAEVETNARRVLAAVATTLREPVGTWLLGAREEARTEYGLTVWDERANRVRMDRVFRAGASPQADGHEYLWIVDYKTGSHGSEGVEAFLEAERAKYAGQMERYARALGGRDIRLGLWYPMIGRLVWWIAADPSVE